MHIKECPILIDDYNAEDITLKIYTNKGLTKTVTYLRKIVPYYKSKINSYQVESDDAADLNYQKMCDKLYGTKGIEKDVSKDGISKIIFIDGYYVSYFHVFDDKGNEASFKTFTIPNECVEQQKK